MRFMSEPQKRSLDAILKGFVTEGSGQPDPAKRRPLTIWLSPEDKEKYDRLQKKSGRRFCDVVRELLVTAIRECDSEPTRVA